MYTSITGSQLGHLLESPETIRIEAKSNIEVIGMIMRDNRVTPHQQNLRQLDHRYHHQGLQVATEVITVLLNHWIIIIKYDII